MTRYELFHYGVKGMKWGVRKARKNSSSTTNSAKSIGLQFFARKASARKTVTLPKKEYAHVMSELMTNITKDQKTHPTITKYIGKHVYVFENNFDDTYRVIGKIPIRTGGKKK